MGDESTHGVDEASCVLCRRGETDRGAHCRRALAEARVAEQVSAESPVAHSDAVLVCEHLSDERRVVPGDGERRDADVVARIPPWRAIVEVSVRGILLVEEFDDPHAVDRGETVADDGVDLLLARLGFAALRGQRRGCGRERDGPDRVRGAALVACGRGRPGDVAGA